MPNVCKSRFPDPFSVNILFFPPECNIIKKNGAKVTHMQIRHPYFSFTKEEIDALRVKIRSDETYRAAYEKITRDKDKIIAEDFVTEAHANSVFDQHGRFGDVSGQLGRFNGAPAAAYLIDGERKYAERIRDLLLHVSSFDHWAGPDNPYQEVPRRSELNTGAISVGMAYAYDIIYDILTPEERKIIGGAIIKNGVMPLLMDWALHPYRIHAMDSMGHNWWSVCVAQGASALLPVADLLPAGEAERLLGAAEDALYAFLTYEGCTLYNKPPTYDGKGLFYESAGYFSYGTGELFSYLWHAERYLGRRNRLRDAFKGDMTEAILSFAYPTKHDLGVMFVNFGDGSTDTDISGFVYNNILLGRGTPPQYEYLSRRHKGRGFFDLMHPEVFEGERGWDGLPLNAFYPDTGYAFCRSSWEDDAVLFAVRCGYTWNHAHADAGHFVLWNRGEELFPDMGTCSYQDPAYRNYFCTDLGHNVLLIGGKGQVFEDQYRGNKFHGKLFDTYEGKDFVYVGADATGPLAHLCCRAYRNFILIENRVLLVIDDVRSHETDTVQFLLHYNGTWTDGAKNGVKYTAVRGEKTGADVYHVFPADLTAYESEPVTVTPDGGVQCSVSHLVFSETTPGRSHLMIHAIVLDPDENDIEITPLNENEGHGVRIKENDTGIGRRVWFNIQADGRRMHKNSNALIDGFETDAYIFMRSIAPDGGETVFLTSASYFRKPGEEGFGAYIKRTDEF